MNSRPSTLALPHTDNPVRSDGDQTSPDTSTISAPSLYSQENSHLTEDATFSQSDDGISLQELPSTTTAFAGNDLTLRHETDNITSESDSEQTHPITPNLPARHGDDLSWTLFERPGLIPPSLLIQHSRSLEEEDTIGQGLLCHDPSTIIIVMRFLYRHVFLLHYPPAYYESVLKEIQEYPNMNEDEDTRWNDKFLDVFIGQWRMMLSFGCGVLLSTVVAVLQIANTAQSPVTSAIGIIIFSSAFIGVLFCGFYWAHMARLMRRERVHMWIEDARRSSPSMQLWKNPAMLLAAPAAWLMWALILMFPFILSYIWAEQSDRRTTLLVSHLAGTFILATGVAHLCMVAPAFAKLGSEPLESTLESVAPSRNPNELRHDHELGLSGA